MLRHDPSNMNAKRSITLLTEALMDLMHKKDFKKISVSEITNHAGLVRSTFYAHFSTKLDVLSHFLLEILKERFDRYQEKGGLTDREFVQIYFEVWGEQVRLLELLLDHDLLSIFNELDSHFEFICHNYFSMSESCMSDKGLKYVNAFYADAMASVLKRWIKTGMEESVEDLTAIFFELATYNYSIK